ncbi:MAG: 4Fe-4S binding protein [Faecalibacillus faecis]
MSRSAYVAHVEKDKCVACGRCVEYCPAGAVCLGQKLCKKDGSEIKYPKQELPMLQNGDQKNTILIIVIIIELILMKQEQLL